MKAYELIEKPGTWCQGAYYREGTSEAGPERCLVGVLCTAYSGPSKYNPAYNKVDEYLKEHYNSSPVPWNDTPGRTREEVYNLLKLLDL